MSEKPAVETTGKDHRGRRRVIVAGSVLALGVVGISSNNSLGLDTVGHSVSTGLGKIARHDHKHSSGQSANVVKPTPSAKAKRHQHGSGSLPDYSKYTILSLGGSYAAGGGLPGMVADTKKGCRHSPDSYPSLMAHDLGMLLVQDACSGAKSAQILQETQGRKVEKFPLLAIDKAASSEDAAGIKDTFFTLMVGANDGKFIELEKNCLTVGCTAAQEAAYEATLPATGENITTIIRNLKTAGAPLVIVNQYPALDWGDTSCLPGMAATSQTVLRNSLHDLNNTIASSAQAAGAVVVAPTDFKGHGICAPDDEKWIQWHGVGGTMSLHPNIEGQQALATRDEAVVRAFLKASQTDS